MLCQCLRVFFCSILLLFISIGELTAQKVDVILIGGQSNATGQGYMRNIPSSFDIDKNVMFYYSKYLNQGKDVCCELRFHIRFMVPVGIYSFRN